MKELRDKGVFIVRQNEETIQRKNEGSSGRLLSLKEGEENEKVGKAILKRKQWVETYDVYRNKKDFKIVKKEGKEVVETLSPMYQQGSRAENGGSESACHGVFQNRGITMEQFGIDLGDNRNQICVTEVKRWTGIQNKIKEPQNI